MFRKSSSKRSSPPTLTPLWDGLVDASEILQAAETSHLASSMKQMADLIDHHADAMEAFFEQSSIQAAKCEQLQAQCMAVESHLLAGFEQGSDRGGSEAGVPPEDASRVPADCKSGEEACSMGLRHATIRKAQGRALAARLSDAASCGNPLLLDEEGSAGMRALESSQAPSDSPSARTPFQPLTVNPQSPGQPQQQCRVSKPAMHDVSPGGNSQQAAYSSAWTGSQQQPPLQSTPSPTRPSNAPGGRHSRTFQTQADEGTLESSAALSATRSSAAAAVPGREDAVMVCNPLYANASVSRSQALQPLAAAEGAVLQFPATGKARASSQTDRGVLPPKPSDSRHKHAGAPAQERGEETSSLQTAGAMPVEGGATGDEGASSFWGLADRAGGEEEVSLVSSPRASKALQHGTAVASVTGKAASHPGPCSGGNRTAASEAALPPVAGVLPDQAHSLTAAAFDNPWAAGSAAAPDQASAAGPPQRQRGRPRLPAQQPDQAPAPSSCASHRPFFPPASRYGGAVDCGTIAAKGGCAASARAQPCQAQAASEEVPQQRLVQEAVRQANAAEPDRAAAEAFAGTRTGTVVVKREEAAVGSEARAAWEALRQVPRESGAAQGRTSPQCDAPRTAPQPPATEGTGTPSDEALLRRLMSARQGPLAASSTAVLRTSLHSTPDQAPACAAAPREAAPLTSRSDPAHRREPSTMAFLRHSGVFPAQGPLGASHGALLRSSAPQPPPEHALPQRAGHMHGTDHNAGRQDRLQQRTGGAPPAAVPGAEPEQAERPRPDVVQLPRACALPVSRPRLCPPPHHLRTPTLMQRAGDVSAYEEVEAFPTTPRGPSFGQQAHALAGNPLQCQVPASSGNQSPPPAAGVAAVLLVAAPAPGVAADKAGYGIRGRSHLPPPPAHLRQEAFPAPSASAKATLPKGVAHREAGVGPLTCSANQDAAGAHAAEAARLSGRNPQQQARQQPPEVFGSALAPNPAQLRPCSSISRTPQPSQNGAHKAAAVPKQAPPPPPPPPLQQQRPVRISAGALADAAGRLKPAARGNGASHGAQKRESEEEQEGHAQLHLRPSKVQEQQQPADPMAELLGAIKAGAYKLRKNPAPAAAAGGHRSGEQAATVPGVRIEDMMQRAMALRAAAYPESTVASSSASRWND